MNILLHQTLIIRVIVSPLHEYSITLDHNYFICLYHHYTDTPLHETLLFHVLVSQLHKFTWVHDLIDLTSPWHEYSLNIDTWLFSESLILIWHSLLYEFAYIHALIVLVFLLHGLLFLLHELLLLEYSCITITWPFPEYSTWLLLVFWCWYDTHATLIYQQLI